jgi:hypothetical protein
MRYLILIYTDESAEVNQTAAERAAMLQDYLAFTREARAAGVYETGDELHPTRTALTVRVRHEQTLTAPGPVADTHEPLGGYFVLNCNSPAEAAQWAAKIPGARRGAIEVRPMVDFTQA